MSLAYLKPLFSVEKAHKAQLQLSKYIISEDKMPMGIRLIAGVDTAYIGDLAVSAVAVMEYDSLNLVEKKVAQRKAELPYIPTLLSFRELPPTLRCVKKLKTKPDLFLVDGQGLAHPYCCGFASHLGVVLGKPTIGVAKSKLIGEVEPFRDRDFAYLWHGGKIVGAALKTVAGGMAYVSVGHMVSLETAIRIVKHCIRHSNIPEPIRLAHRIATVERDKIRFSHSCDNKV